MPTVTQMSSFGARRVGDRPGQQREDAEEHHADDLHDHEVGVAEPRPGTGASAGLRAVGEGEARHQVEEHVRRQHDERAEDEVLPVRG
jgi:hypothetical protein